MGLGGGGGNCLFVYLWGGEVANNAFIGILVYSPVP